MTTLINPLSIFTKRLLFGAACALAASLVHAAAEPVDTSALVKRLSLEQQIGQLQQAHCEATTVEGIPEELKAAIRNGQVGTVLNAVTPEVVDALQRIAVTETEHKIPLVFARDVIHGFRTIMPIPLGQAASWNPELVKQGARIAAVEASSVGIRWTFAPMLDISRDPRWGRIAESFGEDPYLTSVLATASVQGYQGSSLANSTSMAATAKHFLGYGAAEGGRDYDATYIPEPLLHNIYLPPFTAAVNAGTATIMSAFNNLNGVPASGNAYILDTILRKELGFRGVVVSDWGSVIEMKQHGYAADDKEAALRAFTAGVDIEMVSTTYQENLAQLVREGKIPREDIEKKAARVLQLKKDLALFAVPYVQGDPRTAILAPEHKNIGEQLAIESLVLLKNSANVLPLSANAKIALIGPLADAPHDQMGTWVLDGQKQDSVSVLAAMQSVVAKNRLFYHEGIPNSRSDDTQYFKQAVKIAKKSDVIVFVGGEEAVLSGEAHSRADIRLPGAQEALIKALKATGKPVVLVILAGRQIALNEVIQDVDGLLMAWHPGSMGGPAVAKVIMGEANPSGRLPVTWPKVTGQIPLYYNHANSGRPANPETYLHMSDYPEEAGQHSTGHQTYYIDAGFEPQFPFGFGLSYSSVEYRNIALSQKTIKSNQSLSVQAEVQNTGTRAVHETVQLYIRDVTASSVRPIRELKDFKRVALQPGEKATVSFEVTTDDLAFFNQDLQKVVEPGLFEVWIAPDAASGLKAEFIVQ